MPTLLNTQPDTAQTQPHTGGGYVALTSDSDGQRSPSASSPTPQRSRELYPPEDILYATPHNGVFIVHPAQRSYSYAYGPKGLLGLLHNPYTLGCAVFASIGGLLFGYDQGVIANVLVMRDFVERWPVSAWEKGLMSEWSPAPHAAFSRPLCRVLY